MPRKKKEGKYYEVRLYKSHDADLLALWADGVKLSKMLKTSVENYVHQKNIKYRISKCRIHKLNGSGVIRYHLFITDPDVISLLDRIRKGRRNQFFKNILREALLTEPMGGYFIYEQDAAIETKRIQSLAEPQIIEITEYAKPESDAKRVIQKRTTKNQTTDKKQKAVSPETTKSETKIPEKADQTKASHEQTSVLHTQKTRPENIEISEPAKTEPISALENTDGNAKDDRNTDNNNNADEESMLLSMFDKISGQI